MYLGTLSFWVVSMIVYSHYKCYYYSYIRLIALIVSTFLTSKDAGVYIYMCIYICTSINKVPFCTDRWYACSVWKCWTLPVCSRTEVALWCLSGFLRSDCGIGLAPKVGSETVLEPFKHLHETPTPWPTVVSVSMRRALWMRTLIFHPKHAVLGRTTKSSSPVMKYPWLC